jgi:Uma2 family endonuclease
MAVASIDKTKVWTVDDYLLLGEMNSPCQLINGELIMSPSPSPRHQLILQQLFRMLDKAKGKGVLFVAPLDLYIDKKNVFQPDLLYLSEQNKKFITERGIEGPPDLIVEIISPSNSYTDRNIKKKTYLNFGVQEYWIVDPGNKTIEAYTPETGLDSPLLYLAEEGAVTSQVLPVLNFNLTDIFNL